MKTEDSELLVSTARRSTVSVYISIVWNLIMNERYSRYGWSLSARTLFACNLSFQMRKPPNPKDRFISKNILFVSFWKVLQTLDVCFTALTWNFDVKFSIKVQCACEVTAELQSSPPCLKSHGHDVRLRPYVADSLGWFARDTPVVTLEQVENVHESRSVRKMAASTCS